MKIRTDFVTNSSSSSFTLIVDIKPKEGKPIRYRATGGVGEGDEEYYELVATKSPSVLGSCKTVADLASALIESIGQDGIHGSGPAEESNRVLNNHSAFIKKVRSLPSMDEISSITITGKLNGNYDAHWYRVFSYDMTTQQLTEKEDGEEFMSEGTGGELKFSKEIPDYYAFKKEQERQRAEYERQYEF